MNRQASNQNWPQKEEKRIVATNFVTNKKNI